MKTKRIISSILAAATVLSVAGCNGGAGGRQEVSTTTGAATTTTAATTTLDTDEALQEAVGNIAEETKLELTVDKKIKWLAWWDIDETQAAAELFKAQYGVPEEGEHRVCERARA